jgi:hypothetical protein
MADTPGVLVGRDASTPSVTRNIGGTTDSSGIFYSEQNLRFDGELAGAAFPFPFVDAAAGILLTAIEASAAATATETAAAVALLTTIAGEGPGSGGATATLQTTGNASLATIAGFVDEAADQLLQIASYNTLNATNALQTAGNTSLTAAAASLVTIVANTGAGATAALQATGNASTVTIATQITAAAASLVVVATQITAAAASLVTVVANTGAGATSALQGTGNTSLASLVASNATIATNTAGAATATSQATGNASLAAIATNTGAATPAGTNQIGMAMPQIGAAVPPFTVLTTDGAITGLTLPGKMRIQFPLYQIGTASTPNVGQVQINYAGGNSLTAPTAMMLPGETDDWIVVTGTTAPHVSCPAGSVQIVIQQ